MDDGGSPLLIGMIVLLVLLILNGIVSAFQSALSGENETKYKATTDLLLCLLDLIAGFFCIRFLASGIMNYQQSDLKPAIQYLIQAGSFVCVYLLLMASAFAGQNVSRKRSTQIEKRWGSFHYFFKYLLLPFYVVANGLGRVFSIVLGVNPVTDNDDVTEEEIISMVNEGHEQGVIKSNEAEMIHNIFEFGDKEAEDIMTHRKNMVLLDGTMTVVDALNFMLDCNNSRFPVYLEEVDNIIGIVHIKDVMLANREDGISSKQIQNVNGLIRKAEFIPETRKINALFQTMQLEKNHMVIVVDEYGQTSGLVTMEDILEEIVGNIMDEYDEEDNSIVKEESGSYLVSGMADLEEVQDELGIEFDLDDYDTLNGFLISEIGDIPQDGKKYEIQYEGYLFQTLKVENKLIQTVRIEKIPESKIVEEEEK